MASYNPWNSTAIYFGANNSNKGFAQQTPAEEEDWAALEKQIWAAAEQSSSKFEADIAAPFSLGVAAGAEMQQMTMEKKATNDFEGRSETASTTDAGDTTPSSPFDSQDSGLEDEEEELLAKVPRDENGNLTSIGSLAHGEPNHACKPCVFAHNEKKPCASGVRCAFCHFPHAPKMRVRLPKKQREERKQQMQMQAEKDAENSAAAAPPQASAAAAPTTTPKLTSLEETTKADPPAEPEKALPQTERPGEMVESVSFSNPAVPFLPPPPPGLEALAANLPEMEPLRIGLLEGAGVAPHGAPWYTAAAPVMTLPPGLESHPEMLTTWLEPVRVVGLTDAASEGWPLGAAPENSMMRMEPARVSLTQASEAWFQAAVALPLAQPTIPCWLPEEGSWAVDQAGQAADSWSAIEAELLAWPLAQPVLLE